MTQFMAIPADYRFNAQDVARQLIGIIGAGTMGAGIAQVAACAGHPVFLMDAREGAALAARNSIATALARLVAKQRLSQSEFDVILARIVPVANLAELADAAMVVEVIVENMQAKQTVLREIEGYVGRHTILASNTSSISITAIANGMQFPDRVIGMHFFNPVPLMKLVEVVSGAETNPVVAGLTAELAKHWGKTTVHAKSTPGFIVNRIARPFYAEALTVLQEQATTPAEIDRAARSAGFRMGPCELMDLIGHDINYAVTVSMFEANYGDRRYKPSLVQKALVEGGRLGRKSGRGLFEPTQLPQLPQTQQTASTEIGSILPIEVVGNSALITSFARLMEQRKIEFTHSGGCSWNGLRLGTIELHICDGQTAAQLAALTGVRQIAVLDLPLLSESSDAIAIACAPGLSVVEQADLVATLNACGLKPVVMGDVPGLLIARTVAMLINEAADTVYQGVCDSASADQAMKLGTNYPFGPFEWLEQIGVTLTVTLLDNLFSAYRCERYRVSPMLQQRFWRERQPI